jgi:hypothetical protein
LFVSANDEVLEFVIIKSLRDVVIIDATIPLHRASLIAVDEISPSIEDGQLEFSNN